MIGEINKTKQKLNAVSLIGLQGQVRDKAEEAWQTKANKQSPQSTNKQRMTEIRL